MRACLYCQGLLIARGPFLVCTSCGHWFTVEIIDAYTDAEWAALVSEGLVRVSGELH